MVFRLDSFRPFPLWPMSNRRFRVAGQILRGRVPRAQVRHQLRRLRPQQQVHCVGKSNRTNYIVSLSPIEQTTLCQ